jgi:hypothetical protein
MENVLISAETFGEGRGLETGFDAPAGHNWMVVDDIGQKVSKSDVAAQYLIRVI